MTMPMMRLMLMRMGSASSVAGVAGVAGARGGARRAAEFVQRQVRQHTARSRLTIEDHLIGVAQNTLHSFEIHAPARDVGVLPIGVVNREEALRLTLRLVLEALLVGLGALPHPQRLEIGRASGRARVGQYVWIWGGARP